MIDSRADVRLSADLESEPIPAPVVLEERAFNIGVFGDFSGRDGTDPNELSARSAHLVDIDDFDDVLARVAPRLRLGVRNGDTPIEVSFSSLDDFHPDSLFERLPLFQALRDLRARLSDASTFAAAAAELRGEAAESRNPSHDDPGSTVETTPGTTSGGLLDLVVDTTAPDSVEPESRVITSRPEFEAYVRRLVAPHLVARPDPRQPELIAQVDGVISDTMRGILHHPRFQALEALWRGLNRLTRRLETGTLLRLYLVNVGERGLRADLLTKREVGRTPLRNLLATGPERGTRGPWSLLVGAFDFGASDEDIQLMYALATVGRAVGAPWIAAARPDLVGCPSVDTLTEPEHWAATTPAWQAFRRLPEAAWLGLVAPRILLRAPYGDDDEECDLFHFEEVDAASAHESFLWGNPALACAMLFGQAFTLDGWRMRPGSVREIDGLPLHIRRGGDPEALPSAEVWLTEYAAERLMGSGVMPFASRKDRNAAQLVRFQSVADPPTALAGQWNQRPG